VSVTEQQRSSAVTSSISACYAMPCQRPCYARGWIETSRSNRHWITDQTSKLTV